MKKLNLYYDITGLARTAPYTRGDHLETSLDFSLNGVFFLGKVKYVVKTLICLRIYLYFLNRQAFGYRYQRLVSEYEVVP